MQVSDSSVQSYANRPGPTSYYSSFSGLTFAASLSFAQLQLIAITLSQNHQSLRRWILLLQKIGSLLYWTILTASGLACTIAYGFTPKPDVVSIQVLILLSGLAGLWILINAHNVTKYNTKQLGMAPYEAVTNTPESLKQRAVSKKRKFFYAAGRYLNRVLKSIHAVLSILFIIGAVNLAMTYRYQNP
jgi:hypothetical protein